MSCLFRAYAHLGLVTGTYRWWISRRKLKTLPKIPVSVSRHPPQISHEVTGIKLEVLWRVETNQLPDLWHSLLNKCYRPVYKFIVGTT
jgi:hypothetical protein